jgi:hypothetical protein
MLAPIGHNNPSSAIELAEPTIEALSKFLKDFPVIANEEEAREAKPHLDRMAATLKAIDDERKTKVGPLNEQVSVINAVYFRWHNANKSGVWDKLLIELRSRLTAFARAEEAKREAAVEAAWAAKEEAERLARQAEQREQQAATDAAQGICDVDIGGAMANADAAFADFQRAGRDLARAERDTKVRIGGGFGKVSTLRNKEVLTVTDWKAAIEEIGLTDRIAEAILTEARLFKKNMGELPAGIAASFERSL